jgi:hypothetical protein
MPLPLSRPDANEVVLVVGRDPLDASWWLYTVERAGDGPGNAEVLASGGWSDAGDDVPLFEQVLYAVPKPAPVVLAGLAWRDAERAYLPSDHGTALRLAWRLPDPDEADARAEEYAGL